MSFANSRLYRMLKKGEFNSLTFKTLSQFASPVKNLTGDLGKLTSLTNPDDMKLTSVFSDAGKRLGGVLGDMAGKINTDKVDYPNSDIIKILNDQEEIALLEREAERLRRIARIQHRKRQRLHEMTAKALKSPYI